MKVIVDQHELKESLTKAARAAAGKHSLPILANVKIEADMDHLLLSATDLELGIVAHCPAQVDEAGAVTAEARLLSEFVGRLPDEAIEVELRDTKLHLACGRYRANIPTIDPDEFPDVAGLGPASDADITAKVLAEAIKRTTFAASNNEGRPVLQAVRLTLSADQMTLAAADGFRLSVVEAEIDGPEEPVEALVPASALDELARLAKGEEDELVSVSVRQGQIVFGVGQDILVSQLIEGKFPDFRAIIPESHETRINLDVDEFLKAVKICDLFARNAAHIVLLSVESAGPGKGRLRLQAQAADYGGNTADVACLMEGEAIEIGFNSQFLSQALGAMDAPRVWLELSDANQPGTLRPVDGSGFTHVIMPMHLAK